MVNIQKKMAAKVMKTGISRIWLNPEKMKDIEKAITKWDVRKLVKKGDIKVVKEKLHARVSYKKRKRGPGSKKGKKFAIVPRKRRWISTVRPQRRMLRELKSSGQLDKVGYRKLYKLVKGGMFRSRAHLRLYIEDNNMLKK